MSSRAKWIEAQYFYVNRNTSTAGVLQSQHRALGVEIVQLIDCPRQLVPSNGDKSIGQRQQHGEVSKVGLGHESERQVNGMHRVKLVY